MFFDKVAKNTYCRKVGIFKKQYWEELNTTPRKVKLQIYFLTSKNSITVELMTST